MASLQSGEDVADSRRQMAEAFGLAERQDELLEDASARLEQLKDESRFGTTMHACHGTQATMMMFLFALNFILRKRGGGGPWMSKPGCDTHTKGSKAMTGVHTSVK